VKGKEIHEKQACQMHRDSHVGVVIVPGVEKGEDVEQDDEQHELGNCAPRDGNLSPSKKLKTIDRCHPANAQLHQNNLGSVKGIVQDGGKDKNGHKEG
jgi:hypothetical protein